MRKTLTAANIDSVNIKKIICTKKLKITKKGHKQERKRFLAKSKGCRDEDAISLVRNVNQQEDNIEQ